MRMLKQMLIAKCNWSYDFYNENPIYKESQFRLQC